MRIAARQVPALVGRAGAAASAVWRDSAGPIIAVVLLIGVVLRVYFVVRWRPALVNYSDTGIYIQDAFSGGFADPLRVVGYGLFLIPLHWLSPHMLLVVLVQHVMGIATAVLLYLTVRRCGAPRLVAAAPMASVALGGTQIFLEHAILSEALFTLLVAAALYAAVRASPGSIWWSALAGLSLGVSVTVRGVGLILVPVFALWLLFGPGGIGRLAMWRAATTLLATVVVIGAYMSWRQAETGLSGLTTNGNWNLYGRVAPFADCTRFTPPPGADRLCDPLRPQQRRGRNVEWYIYSPQSPAQKLLGPPYEVSSDPRASDKLRAFTVAAVLGQPGAYLDAVWRDVIRIVQPDRPSDGDLSFRQFIAYLLHDLDGDDRNDFVESWRRAYYPADTYEWGDISKLEDWERATRVQGPWMLGLLLLAGAGPWVAPKGSRSAALLLSATGAGLLIFPIVTHAYDARFVIPALGPLFAAAGLAAWGLLPTAARVVRDTRSRWARPSG